MSFQNHPPNEAEVPLLGVPALAAGVAPSAGVSVVVPSGLVVVAELLLLLFPLDPNPPAFLFLSNILTIWLGLVAFNANLTPVSSPLPIFLIFLLSLQPLFQKV